MAGVAAIFVGVAVPARAADINAVIEPIQRLIDGLLQIMKAGQATPFRQRVSMLAPVIDQTFNLSVVLQESVGATWAALPPEQQAMLTEAFRRYTVVSYVNSFINFNGQRFEIAPTTRAVGVEQVVQTRIIPKSGTGHELDYVMRDGASGWRAVDVLADGSISRVAVQRSDFRRLLTRGGPKALADSLRSKSADLSDGAA
ncbi:ABC transporter substrate-binding protein [Rhodopila sp.]|uniref:ABC transporter substrate-binding protein n=1 Tax=Rhodopila sp. TaxID=2480087 RepID=UPI003D0B5001